MMARRTRRLPRMPRTPALIRAQRKYDTKRQNQLVSVRFPADELEHLDKLRKEGESRPAAIRRIVAEAE